MDNCHVVAVNELFEPIRPTTRTMEPSHRWNTTASQPTVEEVGCRTDLAYGVERRQLCLIEESLVLGEIRWPRHSQLGIYP